MNDYSERSSISVASHATNAFHNSNTAFNCSTHSLLDSGIVHIVQTKEPKSQKKRRARGRTVTFPDTPEQLAQVVEEIMNRGDLTEDDRSALWFCSDEYLVLKCDTRMESLASERDGLAKALLEGVYTEKSRQSQDKLNRWVAEVGPERRGLEKSINQSLADARQNAQFQSIMDVLKAQDEMILKARRPMSSVRTTSSSTAASLDDEAIRKVYTKATRASRHFARMMAKADAMAVGTSPDAVGDAVTITEKRSSRNKPRLEKQEKSTGTLSDSHSVAGSVSKRKSSSKEKKTKGSKGKSSKDGKDKKDQEKCDKEKDPKHKLTLKQKYKETKAGIIARIPRIA